MKSEIADDYLKLIEQFLDNELTALEFEYSYLNMYAKENRGMGEEIYEVLNTLFYSVDDFVSDPSVVGEGFINESEFRAAAKLAHQQLEAIRRD